MDYSEVSEDGAIVHPEQQQQPAVPARTQFVEDAQQQSNRATSASNRATNASNRASSARNHASTPSTGLDAHVNASKLKFSIWKGHGVTFIAFLVTFTIAVMSYSGNAQTNVRVDTLETALKQVQDQLVAAQSSGGTAPAKLLIANTSSAGDSTAATIDVAAQMNLMVEQMAVMQTGMAGVIGDLAVANAKIVGLTDENDAMRINMTALANTRPSTRTA